MLASTGLAGLGILYQRPRLVVAATVLSLPFVYYLSGHPGMSSVIGLPVLQLGSAYALRRRRRGPAAALLAPFVGTALLTAVAVYLPGH